VNFKPPGRKGPYVALSGTYMDDPAIMKVGPGAELLYVRCLAYACRKGQDGFISDEQMPLAGHNIKLWRRYAGQLVATSLLLRDDERGGYQIRSWLSWNPSAHHFSAGRAAAKRATPIRNPRSGRARDIEDPPMRLRVREGEGEGKEEGRAPSGPARPSSAPPDLTTLRQRLVAASQRHRAGRISELGMREQIVKEARGAVPDEE